MPNQVPVESPNVNKFDFSPPASNAIADPTLRTVAAKLEQEDQTGMVKQGISNFSSMINPITQVMKQQAVQQALQPNELIKSKVGIAGSLK